MRNFIVGTDWWDDCDDAVAMRIIANFVKRGKIGLSAIAINACFKYSVSSLDGFLTKEGIEIPPIGIDREGVDFGGTPLYQKRLSAYASKYNENNQAQEPVKLYRRILAGAQRPLEIIEIGFLQIIAAVLESKGDEISEKSGEELFREKVAKVWVMAGKWNEDGGIENNFARNARSRIAADIFCRKCPVPVTFLGYEVGESVITGGGLDKNDFLYQVLYDYGVPEGRNSWDPMLVLLALTGDEGKAGYFTVQGEAKVEPLTGKNRFTVSKKGSHKYVVKKFDDNYYKRIIDKIINSK